MIAVPYVDPTTPLTFLLAPFVIPPVSSYPISSVRRYLHFDCSMQRSRNNIVTAIEKGVLIDDVKAIPYLSTQ